MRSFFSALALTCAVTAPLFAAEGSDAIPVPSGQPVTFLEVIREAEGTNDETWRFRFVAPDISRTSGETNPDAAFEDMQAICDQYILPLLAERAVPVGQVIISLSERPTEFGKPAPDVTQFFEAYRLDGAQCVWEGF